MDFTEGEVATLGSILSIARRGTDTAFPGIVMIQVAEMCGIAIHWSTSCLWLLLLPKVSMMKLPIPFACLCMLSVSVCFQAVAIDSASQNTSLVKADMTCQRIVLANRSDKHSNFSNTVGFVDTSYADIDDDLLGKGA